MAQEFHVLRCFSCGVYQVQQVKKVNKWVCKVCGQKQSIIKDFGRGSGADCRHHVQKLNAARGAKIEEEAEHRAKMDAQSLWSEANDNEQQLNKPVSRWDKYLPEQKEEEEEPEESTVVMDRVLLCSRKQRVPNKEVNSQPLWKRRRTEQDTSETSGSGSGGPPPPPPPPHTANGGPPPPHSFSSPIPNLTMVPHKAVSKWGAFLTKASIPDPGSVASVLFQSGEDLDLTWTEDWT